jgi:hypothetical protein
MEIDAQSETVKSRFARVYGSPGESPRVIGILKAFWPLLVISLLFGYLFRAALPIPSLSLSQLGLFFIFLAVIGVLLLAMGDRRLVNYLKGAQGEECVAQELMFLSSEYSIFNGIRLDKSSYNIDHIVVGPTGVYVVETKNWSGRVYFQDGLVKIDGKKTDYFPLRQVKKEAYELNNFFKINGMPQLSIKTVLCFVGSELDETISNINGVIVCNKDSLIDVLTLELNDEIDLENKNKANEILISLLK